MAIKLNRAVLPRPRLTGISHHHLAALIEEPALPWEMAVEDHPARGGSRKHTAGTGARHRLLFIDRLTATLIHLRHDLPHAILGLPAEHGCTVPDHPGNRLRTVEELFAYLHTEGAEPRLDATEIQVRRLQAGRGDRRAFVAGKKKYEHDESHRGSVRV